MQELVTGARGVLLQLHLTRRVQEGQQGSVKKADRKFAPLWSALESSTLRSWSPELRGNLEYGDRGNGEEHVMDGSLNFVVMFCYE